MTRISRQIPPTVAIDSISSVNHSLKVVKKPEPIRQSSEVIDQLRPLLEKQIEEALAQIKECQEDLVQTSSGESLEDRTHQTKEEITSLLAIQQGKLVAAQSALDLIPKGKYGVCTKTGELIPLDRLLVCPTATTCCPPPPGRTRV